MSQGGREESRKRGQGTVTICTDCLTSVLSSLPPSPVCVLSGRRTALLPLFQGGWGGGGVLWGIGKRREGFSDLMDHKAGGRTRLGHSLNCNPPHPHPPAPTHHLPLPSPLSPYQHLPPHPLPSAPPLLPSPFIGLLFPLQGRLLLLPLH